MSTSLPSETNVIRNYDDRRNIAVPGNVEQTIQFSAQLFIDIASRSIKDHNYFAVALSGGSTPKSIFQCLTSAENLSKIEWKKCLLFWSDERAVPPTDPNSNYRMAMEAGFNKVPTSPANIFRMVAEENIEENALAYENMIKTKIPLGYFDLVMLGMGDDGHTASLFPKTHGLDVTNRLAIANYVPQHHTWRMSLTFECINSAATIAIYALGSNKANRVKQALEGPYDPNLIPIQKVGSRQHHALWILDNDAAKLL